ncbi:Dpy-30 motif containing protein, putative [Eimeria mitis]|uniref:Dpy-30 motif containing protein, putative n=1 Tax=Eimeria mitis TaxID=44415 RepID=U6KDR6_9EIME|nr:Dpy-30 motif containing protein, putative [Eimeria mitis]CDJ36099.1 Dpy-30 motif containing protein, putative [Eimeria mitis]
MEKTEQSRSADTSMLGPAYLHCSSEQTREGIGLMNPAWNGIFSVVPCFLCLRVLQVFLDGMHGSPDMRISELAIGIMHVPEVQATSAGDERQYCSTPQLPHTLVIPAAERCYKGTDEVFAGLIYQELEEHKAFCILHKPQAFPSSSGECHQAVAAAGDTDSSSVADESSETIDTRNECATPGDLTVEAEINLSCTTPLTILVDRQDLTRFHVCLSSPAIQTVVDGVSYLQTLDPVDVLSQQRITLKPVPWVEKEGIEVCTQQTLSSDDNACRKGRIECGIVASNVSPSQWDFLASSDCLVDALAICEKKRLQLATANNLCTSGQVADDTITTSRMDCRGVHEEQEVQDSKSERGNISRGRFGPFGSHQIPTSMQMLVPLPDIAYLMETVVPVLYPALEAVLRDRPDEPLAYLAFYLLRHSTGYSRTATTLQNSGAL